MGKTLSRGEISIVSVNDGSSSYLHRAWSNDKDGTKDFTTTFKDGMRYLGTYVSQVDKASTNPKDYNWTALFDNVTIGQRNLIKGGNVRKESKAGQYAFGSFIFGKRGDNKFKLEPSKTYTITSKAKAAPKGRIGVILQKPDKWDYSQTVWYKAGEEGVKSVTFTIPSNLPVDTTYTIDPFDMEKVGGCVLEWVVLTEGNVPATDWFPSPEDIDEANELNKKDITKLGERINNQRIGGVNRLLDSESPIVKPYGSSTASYRKDVSIPEWSALNAVESTFSKGDNIIFGTLRNYNESLKNFTHYTHSIYIKNTGSNPFRVNSNTGASEVTIQPNEQRRIILNRYHDDQPSAMQFVFTRFNKDHEIKFISWHAQIEEGNVVTDWSPAPEDFDNKIKGIKVGGRNLLPKSSIFGTVGISSNSGTLFPKDIREVNENGIKFTRIKRTEVTKNPENFSIYSTILYTQLSKSADQLKDGITISFKAKASKGINFKIAAVQDSTPIERENGKSVYLTSEWQTISVFIPNPSGKRIGIIPATPVNPKDLGDISKFYLDICDWKVEEGNTPTAYDLAPEDREQLVSDKINNIVIGGRNLLVEKDITPMMYIDGTGSRNAWEHTNLYDKLVLLNGAKKVVFQYWNDANQSIIDMAARINFFTADGKFISQTDKMIIGNGYKSFVIDIPTNARAVKVHAPRINAKYKLEIGEKATDWSPAPEDVDYKIDNVESAATNRLKHSNVAHELPIIAQAGVSNMFRVERSSIETRDVKKITKIVGNKETWQYLCLDKASIYRPLIVSANQTWTFSASIYSSEAVELGVSLIDGGGTNRNLSFGGVSLSKGWNTINVKTVVDKVYPTTDNVLFFSTHKMNKDAYIGIEWLSLVNGSSNLKQWSPSPDDLRYDLTNVSSELRNTKIGGRNWLANSESPRFTPYQNSNITYQGGVTVESWKATNGVRHTISGGGSTVAAVMVSGVSPLLKNDTEYVHSIYVKNQGDKRFMVTANGGSPFTVMPNTEQRVVIKQSHASNISSMQFVIQRFDAKDTIDFVVWHGQIEEGNVVTDWSPAPEDVHKRIDGIRVGGRNLIDDTMKLSNNESKYGELHNEQLFDGFNIIKTKIDDTKKQSYRDTYEVATSIDLSGNEYILSFWGKSKTNGSAVCYLFSPNTTTSAITSEGIESVAVDGRVQINLTTQWKKYWIKWKQTSTNSKKRIIIARMPNDDNIAYITQPQFEKGNISTDWTPSVNDANKIVDDKIGDIKIGGRNLLRDSANPRSVMVSSNNGGLYPLDARVMQDSQRKYWKVKRAAGKDTRIFSMYSTLNVSDLTVPVSSLNDGVTVSFKVRANMDINFSLMAVQANPNSPIKNEDGKIIKINRGWQVVSAYIPKITGSIIRVNAWQPSNPGAIADIMSLELDICEYKVEEGNMATAWSPAPEDLESAVNGRIDNLKVGGRNLWVESDLKDGYTTTGGAIASAGAITQHKVMNSLINVKPNDKLIMQVWNPSKVDNTVNSNRVSFFDAAGKWISNSYNLNLSGAEYEIHYIDIPSNCHKIRLAAITGKAKHEKDIKIKFEIGNMATDWTLAPEDIEKANETNTRHIAEVEETAKKISAKLIETGRTVDGLTNKYSKQEQTAEGFSREILSIQEKIANLSSTPINFISDSTNIFKRVLLDHKVNVKIYYKTAGGQLISTKTVVGETGKQLVVKAEAPKDHSLVGATQQELSVGETDMEVNFVVAPIIIASTGTVTYKEGTSIIKTDRISSTVGAKATVNANPPANYRIVGATSQVVTVSGVTFAVEFKIEKIPATINIEYLLGSSVVGRGTQQAHMGDTVKVTASAPVNYHITGQTFKDLKVGATTETVKFTVDKTASTITVEYYSEVEKKLISSESIKGFMGETKRVTANLPFGYTTKTTPTTIDILMNASTKTHRFIVEKVPATASKIKVRYYVVATKQYIEGETLNSFVNSDVTATAKVPQGYLIEGVNKKDLHVTKPSEEIVFNIKEKPKSTITIKHIDNRTSTLISSKTVQHYTGEVVVITADAVNDYDITGDKSKTITPTGKNDVVEFKYNKKTKPAKVTVEYLLDGRSMKSEVKDASTENNFKVDGVPPKYYRIKGQASQTIFVSKTAEKVTFTLEKIMSQVTVSYMLGGKVVGTSTQVGYEGETVTVTAAPPKEYKVEGESTKRILIETGTKTSFNVSLKPTFDNDGTFVLNGETQAEYSSRTYNYTPYKLSKTFNQIMANGANTIEVAFDVVGEVPATASFILIDDNGHDLTNTHKNLRSLHLGNNRYGAKITYSSNQNRGDSTNIGLAFNGLMGSDKVNIKNFVIRIAKSNSAVLIKPDLKLFGVQVLGSFAKIDSFVIDDRFIKDSNMTFSVYGKPSAEYVLRIGIVDETGKETFKDSNSTTVEGYISITSEVKKKWKSINFYLANVHKEKSNEILYKHVQAELGNERNKWIGTLDDSKMIIERINRLENTAKGLENTVSTKVIDSMREVREWADSRLKQTDKLISGTVSTDKSYGGFSITSNGAKMSTPNIDISIDNQQGFKVVKKSAPAKTVFQIDANGIMTMNGGTSTGGSGGSSSSAVSDLHQAWSKSGDGKIGFTRNKPTENLLERGDRIEHMNSIFMPESSYYLGIGTNFTIEAGKKYTFSIECGSTNGTGGYPVVNLGIGSSYGAFVFDITKNQPLVAGKRTSINFIVSEADLNKHGNLLSFRVRNDKKPLSVNYGKVKVEDGYVNETTFDSDLRYVGYSTKDSNNPLDYRWSRNINAASNHMAWSNSPDGKLGFTRKYPSPNLVSRADDLLSKTLSASGLVMTKTEVPFGVSMKMQGKKEYGYLWYLSNLAKFMPYAKSGEVYTISYDLKTNRKLGQANINYSVSMNDAEIVYTNFDKYHVEKSSTEVVRIVAVILIHNRTANSNFNLHFMSNATPSITPEYIATATNLCIQKGAYESGIFLASREDSPEDSVPKYVGHSVVDSDLYYDYQWTKNTDYIEGYTESIQREKIGKSEYRSDLNQLDESINSKADLEALRSIENMTKDMQEKYTEFLKDGGRYSSDLAELEKRSAALIANLGNQVAQYNFITKYITMGQEGLLIGDSSSLMKILVSNDKISFIDSGQEIAYMKGQEFKINRGTILESLQVGKHRMEQFDEDNTVFKFIN